jgi:hypothetical protein
MKENIIDTIKENEDRYRIHVNYQFDIEVDEGEYYVVRRKQQYPKSYEDCCKILNTPIDNFISKGAGYPETAAGFKYTFDIHSGQP